MEVLMSSVKDRPRATLALAGVIALLLAAACGDDNSPPATTDVVGSAVPVGNGTARTVIVTSQDGAQSIGVELTAGALTGLPGADAEFMLPLPDGMSVPPWDHVSVNWNAHGHPPDAYMLPHFDLHFYTIGTAEQSGIAGGPDMVPVPDAYVPKDYVSGVESVPDMGVHWVDTLSAEFHGHTFDHTLIYGFSQGSMVFVEPMVTQAFLGSQPSVSMEVKQPQAFQEPGRYPRSWSVRTQPGGVIRVTLDSLVSR
jgi:hypothetical protein